MIDITLLLAVDPAAIDRARRLAFAVRLVREGTNRADITRTLAERFDISRKTAYRIASIAFDIGQP